MTLTGWEEPVIRCARAGCAHPFTDHEPVGLDEDRMVQPGGRCLHAARGPGAVACWCRGFLWVNPSGSYSTPPNPRDYGLLPDGTPDLGDTEG